MKRNLVILGTGFAAFSLIKKIDTKHYDLTVISPRNHFLFTPLLPSSTVGTVEFRSIIEPIRTAREGLTFFQAIASKLDTANKTVQCRNAVSDEVFDVKYDWLLITVGAANNTFGIEGVRENAMFLKEVADARSIRTKIIDNFERAATPEVSQEERSRLLHFVIVGGGPTGVEFAAELADFLEEELAESYHDLVKQARITLVEALGQILNSFDADLSKYASEVFKRRKISVLTNTPVKEVKPKLLCLKDGSEIAYGLLVWSTGYTATDFIKSLPFEKDKAGRILTDGYFRVPNEENIFAMGDCARPESKAFPQTSQVAMQEGKYLGKLFNRMIKKRTPENLGEPFEYNHLGMLAYIGDEKALADLPVAKSSGFATWIFWRSAYLTRLVSLKNKVLVLFDWCKAALFGRDVSRF
ncbi:MAG: FAD-dependent oxidoreductase [Rhizobacter sp.]|nr:FAD-dependent oxidoreductase [Chlorobiales bacterium]